MSKIPKVYRSTDYDAPKLLGDSWGYINDLFRKCLVTGYNERTDLSSYTFDSGFITFTFDTAHNYNVDQAIDISGISTLLDQTCLIKEVVSDKIIKCVYFEDVYLNNGSTSTGLSARAIVSPLGWREKYRNGDKSVYVVDQEVEDCYYVVDGSTPQEWTNMVTSTTYPPYCMPIVYMCKKIDADGNAVGSMISPFDSDNPTRYNSTWKTDTTAYNRHGIGFVNTYYGVSSQSSNTKVVAESTAGTWYIIGNGRFFWLFTQTKFTGTSGQSGLYVIPYMFGKIYNKHQNDFDYVAMLSTLSASMNQYSSDMAQPHTGHYIGVSPQPYITPRYKAQHPIYTLSKTNRNTNVRFNVGYGLDYDNLYAKGGWNLISGSSTYKYASNDGSCKIESITLTNEGCILGLVPSIKYLNHSPNLINNMVYTISIGGDNTRMLSYIIYGTAASNSGTLSAQKFLFSLEYKDWMNYE